MTTPLTPADIKAEILSHPLGGKVLQPLMEEHQKLEKILLGLRSYLLHFGHCRHCDHCAGYKDILLQNLSLLTKLELHHAREEHILHREIEKQGIFGTQDNLHDFYLELKQALPPLLHEFQWRELPYPKTLLAQGEVFIDKYLQLISDEELNLYTTAIGTIQDKNVWEAIRQAFDQIGYDPIEPAQEDFNAYWHEFAKTLD